MKSTKFHLSYVLFIGAAAMVSLAKAEDKQKTFALVPNRELYALLEEHHFEIEHKGFPKRPCNQTDGIRGTHCVGGKKLCSSLNGAAESVQGPDTRRYNRKLWMRS